MNTWVTIPCHRPYLDQLRDCIGSLNAAGVDGTRIIVVANGPDPIRRVEVDALVHQYQGDWNISKWWNLGLDLIAGWAGGADHEALVLNADATVEPDAVEKLSYALRALNLAITAPDIYKQNGNEAVRINEELRPLTKWGSLPGCAMMLRGELDLRFDTRIPGWFNDDDMDWQGRSRGGVGMVRDAIVHHDDHGAGDQHKHEGLAVFQSKWGSVPWR